MTVTLHAADVVLPVCADPVPDGAVLVDAGMVADVGTREELVARHTGARVRSWPGVLTPGLVNAHAHLQYTDFAPLATGGLPFPEWIATVVRWRADFDEARWVESTRRGLHAALRTGTTCVADVVTDPCALVPTARVGLAGVSYVEAVLADDATWTGRARESMVTALDAAPPGRVLGISPHTLYTLSSDVFTECVHLARTRRLRLHPHLAETVEETEFVASGTGPFAEAARQAGLALDLVGAGTGRSPAAQLEALGALGPDVHVAHGVHCGADDRALLASTGTAVALCPRSNAILSAGEAPVAAYLDEGVPVAVGTDSLASSPSLDLWADVAAARRLARRQGYDAADLDRRLVEAATLGGARAMGLGDVGVLRPGARADLAVFDVPAAAGADPYTALVDHAEGRCVATVLGGRLVHRRPARVRG